MQRIWLLVIILLAVATGVLAFTWSKIPYLNTVITNLGVADHLTNLHDGIIAAVSGNPAAMLGVVGSLGGLVLGLLKVIVNKAKAWYSERDTLLTNADATVASITAQHSTETSGLLQNIQRLTTTNEDLTQRVNEMAKRVDGLSDERDKWKDEYTKLKEQWAAIEATV